MAVPIEKAFKLAATGTYSLGNIANILHDEGFSTKKEKEVSKSHLQVILKRPTYYGYFLHNCELFEGNYEPIISKTLFDIVQDKLEDRSKPKKVEWVREFVRLIRCGNCGCAVTTTLKRKYIKKTKEWKIFIYHHCAHRKGNCEEKPLTHKELKAILFSQVERILLDKETWQLGLEIVRQKYAKEIQNNKNQHFFYSLEQQRIRDKLQRIIDMRTNGELTKEEFIDQKDKILVQLSKFENKTIDVNQSLKTWLELMEDFLNTAFQIQEILEHGKPEQKQKVLAKIGENFILKDEKLTFSFKKPHDVLLQPEMRQEVLLDLDSNQDKRIQSPLSYH